MDNVSQAVSWSTIVMGLSMGISRSSVGSIYDLTSDATICFIAGGVSLLLAGAIYFTLYFFRPYTHLPKLSNERNFRSNINEKEVTYL